MELTDDAAEVEEVDKALDAAEDEEEAAATAEVLLVEDVEDEAGGEAIGGGAAPASPTGTKGDRAPRGEEERFLMRRFKLTCPPCLRCAFVGMTRVRARAR